MATKAQERLLAIRYLPLFGAQSTTKKLPLQALTLRLPNSMGGNDTLENLRSTIASFSHRLKMKESDRLFFHCRIGLVWLQGLQSHRGEAWLNSTDLLALLFQLLVSAPTINFASKLYRWILR